MEKKLERKMQKHAQKEQVEIFSEKDVKNLVTLSIVHEGFSTWPKRVIGAQYKIL